jgi:hypothetical protein
MTALLRDLLGSAAQPPTMSGDASFETPDGRDRGAPAAHIPGFLTPEELADLLGISVRTLSRWHLLRIGPPRCDIGKLRLYRQTSVNDWLASQESEPVRFRRGRGGRS